MDHRWPPQPSSLPLPVHPSAMACPTKHTLLDHKQTSTQSRRDVAHLMDLLRAIPAERVQELRQGMHRHHHAFHWEAEFGSTAYNLTLRSLHRKLHNLWGTPTGFW